MRLIPLVLILLSTRTYGQEILEKIQGDWVCVGILDSNGQPTTGKFGGSTEYLRFGIRDHDLTITEAPFDVGLELTFAFKGEKSIDLVPGAVYELPERIYEVADVNSDWLALSTKGAKKETITYVFANQRRFLSTGDNINDMGALIVKHLRLSKKGKNTNTNRVFEYQIPNDSIHLSPSPTFKFKSGGTFGHMFSHHMTLPEGFKMDVVSEEMILEFDVTESGAGNVRIPKGLDPALNAEVLRVMDFLKDSWKPLQVDGKPVKTSLRFHVYFFMTVSGF